MKLNILRPRSSFGLVIAGFIILVLASCRVVSEERLQYDIFNHVLSTHRGNRTVIIVYRHSDLHEIHKRTPDGIMERCTEADPGHLTAPDSLAEEEQINAEVDACLRDNWVFSKEIAARMIEIVPSLDPTTLQSFRERNIGPHPIDEAMLLVPGVRVSTGIYEDCNEECGAKMFVEFSRVGFSINRLQALVYFGIWHPSARGWFILLENIEGHWVQVAKVEAWIA